MIQPVTITTNVWEVGAVKTGAKFCSRVRKESVSSMGRLPCLGDLLRPQKPRRVAKKSRGSRPVFLLSHPSSKSAKQEPSSRRNPYDHSPYSSDPGVTRQARGGPGMSCLRRRAADHEEISGLDRTAFDRAGYASQGKSPATKQDSLPAAGPALPDGIGYPQGSSERFRA